METWASFRVGGQLLHGMLHLPDLPAPPGGFPSVVILHGYTGNRGGDHRLLPLLSRFLMTVGVASLRFDFRGSGESEGDFSEMTVSREVEDVAGAFEFMRARPELKAQRVSLLGFSMGGMVAALSAPGLQPEKLALWAPALPELWLNSMPDARVLPDVIDVNGWPLGRGFLEELPDLNPLATVAEFAGPVRVFHGSADPTVPLSVGERYAEAAGANLVVVDGANHCFDSLAWVRELYEETARFLTAES